MSWTLEKHLNRTRKLLHDASAKYYPDVDLVDYINESRKKVASETSCLRELRNIDILTDTFIYEFPSGAISILGIYVLWGTVRYSLKHVPFSTLQIYRFSTTWKQQPTHFSIFGRKVYIYPIPNIDYPSEWDVTVFPSDLTNLTDPEVIPYPFDELVCYYAAHLAKFNEQSYEEAQRFKELFDLKLREANASVYRNLRLDV